MTETIKDVMETLIEYANGGVSGLYPPEDDIQELVDYILDLQEEIERLNNIIKTKDEGIKAFTEDLCEESVKVEKLEKLNKILWEENTRLSNGRELDQNAIDTLRDRIDKVTEYIKSYINQFNGVYPIADMRYLDLHKLLNILKGSDKE